MKSLTDSGEFIALRQREKQRKTLYSFIPSLAAEIYNRNAAYFRGYQSGERAPRIA